MHLIASHRLIRSSLLILSRPVNLLHSPLSRFPWVWNLIPEFHSPALPAFHSNGSAFFKMLPGISSNLIPSPAFRAYILAWHVINRAVRLVFFDDQRPVLPKPPAPLSVSGSSSVSTSVTSGQGIMISCATLCP